MGGELGISVEGLSLGGSWSVSKTVTDTMGEGIEKECPKGPWYCSMQIVPGMARVKGQLHNQDNDESCDTDRIDADHGGKEGKEFQYTIPLKDASGNGKWTPELCTCGNLDGKDAPGHPQTICPEECTPHE